MASMPSRIESLRIALPGILAQVDRLYLYLDQCQLVPPEFASDSRIVPLLPRDEDSSLRGAGKFFGLSQFSAPCLYFCFDDDIAYPAGYVDHLAAALARHRFRALIGLHGAVYAMPLASYVRDRTVLHFGQGLRFDVVVDELGTGALAFHSECISIDLARWHHPNMADLSLMLAAVQQGVPRICIRRAANYLQPISENQPDSIYIRSLADDTTQTRLLQAAMSARPDHWCMSSPRHT